MKSLYFTVALPLIFTIFLLYSPNPFTFSDNWHSRYRNFFTLLTKAQDQCELFKGKWVPDLKGPSYSNISCSSIPDSKNCFKHGRQDTDFLYWRWKPDGCELPRFNPNLFLATVKGKTMAFIGDSISRNHAESFLCQLSTADIPLKLFKDADDRFRTWYFSNYNFTLMVLWTRFLVADEERVINGTHTENFDLHLDRMNKILVDRLPEIDYAIISDVHWFFRKNYLYENGTVVGCLYCNETNIESVDVEVVLRKVIGTVLNYINGCKECKSIITLFRTYSPAHFENGAWNTGGNCNRTQPLSEGEINFEERLDWKLRNIQVEEIEKIREVEKGGKRFGVLDVTKAMLMRPDGHPDPYWGNKWFTGYNDCVHWCLPGPIDMWNDLLMALLWRYAHFS